MKYKFEDIFKYIKKSILKVATKNRNLHEPLFDKSDVVKVSKTIYSSFVSTSGQETLNFEKKIKKFTKSKYCIALNSGTSALHVGLLSLGVKKMTKYWSLV